MKYVHVMINLNLPHVGSGNTFEHNSIITF